MGVDPLSGKTITVTGGTGSFGQTIVRRALKANADRVQSIFVDAFMIGRRQREQVSG